VTLKEGEEGLIKPLEYRHMGRWVEVRVWPNHHVTFIVAKKKLSLQFILLYLRYMWGEGGWLKTS